MQDKESITNGRLSVELLQGKMETNDFENVFSKRFRDEVEFIKE
jgi:hypothetical protein